MKNPTETKTPQPVGATEIVKREPDKVNAYIHFDDLDISEIVAAQEGKGIGKLIYTWPNADKNGSKDCIYDGCKSKGKPHSHIFGVGINGINELVRHMGGIEIQIGDPRSVRKGGALFYECEAWAKDLFTGTVREAKVLIPEAKIKHMPVQHRFTTVQSFAERNAAKKLLDQNALAEIAEIGRQGRDTFNDEDVQRVFGPMYRERQELKKAYFNMLLQKQLVTGSESAPVRAQIALQRTEALPEGESSQGDEAAPGGGGRVTKPQYGALRGLLKKGGLNDDQAKAFIDEINATESPIVTASEYIGAFKDGNFEDVKGWLERQGKSDG